MGAPLATFGQGGNTNGGMATMGPLLSPYRQLAAATWCVAAKHPRPGSGRLIMEGPSAIMDLLGPRCNPFAWGDPWVRPAVA